MRSLASLVRTSTLALLPLAGCANSQEEVLLQTCKAHDTAVRALTPQVTENRLSQGQVNALFASMDIGDEICDGSATDYVTALQRLEAELLRLTIIDTTVGE